MFASRDKRKTPIFCPKTLDQKALVNTVHLVNTFGKNMGICLPPFGSGLYL
jgi:hypothetical protein